MRFINLDEYIIQIEQIKYIFFKELNDVVDGKLLGYTANIYLKDGTEISIIVDEKEKENLHMYFVNV